MKLHIFMDCTMSAQLLELLFFAGIAFLIINKLISVLGTASDDDPTKNKSYFGEAAGLKDVTGTATQDIIMSDLFKQKSGSLPNIEDMIERDNEAAIIGGLHQLLQRVPSFDPSNFLRGAKSAFGMIVVAGNDCSADLEELVDKRYVQQFMQLLPSYGKLRDIVGLDAKISEVYMFGNNAFIKVMFRGINITEQLGNLHEEWTFSKSVNTNGKAWYLSNIERIS